MHVPYRLGDFHNYIRELNSDSDRDSDAIFATYIHFSRRNRNQESTMETIKFQLLYKQFLIIVMIRVTEKQSKILCWIIFSVSPT